MTALRDAVYGCVDFDESADSNLLGPAALSPDSDGFFRTKGTYVHWKRVLGPKGQYSSILRLTAAAALAAPLLALVEEPPFIIVLTGPSSKGKTTAEIYAGSIVGVPTAEDLQNWKVTDARLGDLVRFHNDTLLILDDLATGEGSPKKRFEALRGILHWVSSGGRRGRQTRAVAKNTGRTDSHRPCRTLILTSYEHPIPKLAERAKANFDPGDLVRLLDVPVLSEGSFGIFDHLPETAKESPNEYASRLIDEIQEGCRQQHGALYVKWLKCLVADPIKATTSVKTAMENYLKTADFDHDDGYECRHARHFAILYAALAYGIDVQLLPWSKQKCLSDIHKCHAASRVRLIEANGGLANGLLRLNSHIRDSNRIVNWPRQGYPSLSSSAVDGWRKRQHQHDVITVIGSAFRGWFSSDHERRAVMLDLITRGILHGHKTTDVRVQDPDRKKIRCYVLKYPIAD